MGGLMAIEEHQGAPDVPDRLEAAMARAEEAEAMYRALVERVPAITYTEALDDGRTLSISPQIETLLGYSQDQWMEDSLLWVGLMHPEDRDRVIEYCDRVNQAKEPFKAEYRMIARDGRVVWVRDEAALVLGSRGQPLCWQGVMVDITVQKATRSGKLRSCAEIIAVARSITTPAGAQSPTPSRRLSGSPYQNHANHPPTSPDASAAAGVPKMTSVIRPTTPAMATATRAMPQMAIRLEATSMRSLSPWRNRRR